MQQYEDLVVSLAPTVVHVQIGTAWYMLFEASEPAAIAYRDACTRAGRYSGEGGLVAIEGVSKVQSDLVGDCLYLNIGTRENAQRAEKPLGGGAVRKLLHARHIKRFFSIVKDISDLDEATSEEGLVKQIHRLQDRLAKLRSGKDPLKNSPNGTQPTSDTASDSDANSTNSSGTPPE